MANLAQDEAIIINGGFWSISTPHNNEKVYVTCLQYSYPIKLYFPYDIICLPSGCEAHTMTFVLPSSGKLNVEPIDESPEYGLGFNGSYSKIDNFSLMQSLNISSLTDNGLETLTSKIPEMKHVSISSINSTLTKLNWFMPNIWSPIKVKMFLTIGTPTAVIIILFLSIALYCKCFWNGKSCVHKHTRPVSLPVYNTHIELEPISKLLPDSSDQLSPQIIQEILKASGVDFSKFEHYKHCKAKCHTATQATKV